MRLNSGTVLSVLALAAVAAVAGPATATNLLTNPGFETGDASGWSITGLFTSAVKQDGQTLSASSPYSGDPANVRSGSYVYAIGFNGSSTSSILLSQPVATTAGQTYLVGMYGSTGQTFSGSGRVVTPTFSLGTTSVSLPTTTLAQGTLPTSFTLLRTLVTASSANAPFTASLRSVENGAQSFDDFFVEAFTPGVNQHGRAATRIAQDDSAAGNGTIFKPGLLQQNNNADIVFTTTLNNSATLDGVFKITNNTLIELAREGATAPFAAGQFGLFGSPQINASGQTLFWSRLTGTAGPDDRLYLNTTTGLTQIAVEGQNSPDSNGLVGALSWVGTQPQQLNDQGRAMFYVDFTGSALSQLDGYLYWNNGVTSYVTRRGYAVPGPAGWTHGIATPPRMSDSGSVFWSTAITDGVNTGSALMGYNGLSHTLIARDGTSAPGNGTYVSFSAVSPVNIGNEFAFTATLTGTTGGATDDLRLYLRRPVGIVQLASEGQLSPDSDGTFTSFTPADVNDAGQVAFQASLTGTSSTAGIFRAEPNLTLNAIVRSGDAVPEGAGVFATFGNPQIGPGGQIAFAASLVGDPNNPIYLADDREALLVARWGYEADGKVALGVSGHTQPNVHGQVSYRSDFADGTSAILTFTPRLTWTGATAGSWNTQSDWTLRINPASVHDVLVNNDGALVVTGPTANTTVRSLQIGSAIGSATLLLQPSVTLSALQGTTITANGVLGGTGALSGDVVSAGTIAPGMSPGILTLNGDLTSTGILEFELASLNSIDRLLVQDASLGGSVKVVLLGTFSPAVGDSFDVLDWAGSFTSLGYTFDFALAPLAPGLMWDTSMFAANGTLTVALVPEPGTLGVGLVATLALTRRRR